MSHFKYLPLPTFDEFVQEVGGQYVCNLAFDIRLLSVLLDREIRPTDREVRIELVPNPPQMQANLPNTSNEAESPATVVYITHSDPGLREFITHLVSTYMYIQPPPYHNAEMDELVRFETEGSFIVDEESRDDIDRSCAALTRVHWPLWCFMLLLVCICLTPVIVDHLLIWKRSLRQIDMGLYTPVGTVTYFFVGVLLLYKALTSQAITYRQASSTYRLDLLYGSFRRSSPQSGNNASKVIVPMTLILAT